MDNNTTQPAIKNCIELLIYDIAVKKKDLNLIEAIKERIRTDLDISPKNLTYMLENRKEVSKAEMMAIASILKDYVPEITIDQLTTFCNG